jgi:hypothetical protein
MRSLRLFGLLCALAAGSAVLAGSAFGARPGALLLPSTIQTPHFVVHYQSDLVNNAQFAITQTQAGDVAALAERAYTAEIADGFPAPASDGVLGGDGRIDIYVDNPGALALTVPDNLAASPTTSYIELDGSEEIAMQQHTIAHELFHVIQLSIWQPLPFPAHLPDYWLLEGSAEWMGFRVDHYDPSFGIDLGPSDLSLDCRDPLGNNMCDLTDDYKNNGYSRWPFFEYLAEKYGVSFIRDIFTQAAAGAPAATSMSAISAALVAKGTTLEDAYNAWITTDMTAGYSVTALQSLKPTAYATVETGLVSGTLSVPKVAVNHLSTRYIKFTRGDNDASHLCYAATLNLSVAMPAGTYSKPDFYWDAKGSSPTALSVSGNTATAAIPWDTCTYPSNSGYLALSNASSAVNSIVDAADFTVTATLAVDTTKLTTPTPPPNPVSVNTTVVPVGAADVAPTLELFGPEILKLSPTQTQLRLIVSSNGPGSVRGKLGSVDLGKVTIRAGSNDVRFTLPKNVLKSLRRSASASNVLTLTPVSSDGSASGAPLVRKVSVATPKKPARRKA